MREGSLSLWGIGVRGVSFSGASIVNTSFNESGTSLVGPLVSLGM